VLIASAHRDLNEPVGTGQLVEATQHACMGYLLNITISPDQNFFEKSLQRHCLIWHECRTVRIACWQHTHFVPVIRHHH